MKRFLFDLGVYGFGAAATCLAMICGKVLASLWASPAVLPRLLPLLAEPPPSNVTFVAPNALRAFPLERLAPFAPRLVPKALPSPRPEAAPVLALAEPEASPSAREPHREHRDSGPLPAAADVCVRHGGHRVDRGRRWHCVYAHRHHRHHHG